MARVANLAQNRLIQSVILNTQELLQKKQLQISTLQKSQDYAGIAGDSSRVVTLENSRRRVEEFQSNNSFIQLRIETMINSIAAVKSSVKDMKNLIREILDDGEVPPGVDQDEIAATKLSEIEDFLNVKINGRYLFAGSKTNVKPVQAPELDDSATPPAIAFTSNATTAQPSWYYQGDDNTLSTRINEGVELAYGIQADDPGFEKAIRAIRIVHAESLPLDTNGEARLQHALDLINEAEEQLKNLELNIGIKLEQLSSTNQQLKKTKDYADGIVSDLESANTFEAVAELTQNQSMLEASYAVLVKLSKLTLTSFLR